MTRDILEINIERSQSMRDFYKKNNTNIVPKKKKDTKKKSEKYFNNILNQIIDTKI